MRFVPDGVEVLVRLDSPVCASSNTLFPPWRRRIVVGASFMVLPQDQQDAIIAHEFGHISANHPKIRLFWLFSLKWLNFGAMLAAAREQEFEADAFAARCGFAEPLLKWLSDQRKPQYPTHPPYSERIARLQQMVS